jgi:predicted metal-binding membrane protein
MMAAMMLPSIAPMVLAHARVQIGATPAFVAGYLLTWAAVGLLGYALVEGVRSLDLGVLAGDEAGPYVAAGSRFCSRCSGSPSPSHPRTCPA